MTDCPHDGDMWFDRTLCPAPCNGMHTRCSDCGDPLESCPNREETS